jgi:hypothetical protein
VGVAGQLLEDCCEESVSTATIAVGTLVNIPGSWVAIPEMPLVKPHANKNTITRGIAKKRVRRISSSPLLDKLYPKPAIWQGCQTT